MWLRIELRAACTLAPAAMPEAAGQRRGGRAYRYVSAASAARGAPPGMEAATARARSVASEQTYESIRRTVSATSK
jgi:hypothetical protein